MAKRRKFTAKFKTEVVLEALSGETSQADFNEKPSLNFANFWSK